MTSVSLLGISACFGSQQVLDSLELQIQAKIWFEAFPEFALMINQRR